MKRFTLPLAAALTLVCLCGAAPAAGSLVPTRMTGGGWIEAVTLGASKELYAFELQCRLGDQPNHLRLTRQVSDEVLVVFELGDLTSAFCVPNSPTDPKAGGIYRGTGTGTCNGLPASASWSFQDGGKAGTDKDNFTVVLLSDSPPCNFSVSGPPGGGNLQMHFAVVD